METIPITQEGYDALKKELEYLKSVERPQNIKAIEEARAHGDLSENAEFTAAKEKQSFIQKRIYDIEYTLSKADIIETDNLNTDKVSFGCKITLENIDTGDQVTYQLVGADESNIDLGKISINSPLGVSIIGKAVGDIVSFQVPAGMRSYEVIKIF